MFRMTRFVDRYSGVSMVRVTGRKESDPLASRLDLAASPRTARNSRLIRPLIESL